METERIRYLIETLEGIRKKPELYVGIDLGRMTQFLNGFDAAASVLGFEKAFRKHFFDTIKARKWGTTASLENELQEKGLNESQIADELIAIRIETWKKVLKQLTNA